MKLYPADDSEDTTSTVPLHEFTMNKGEKFLIFECAGELVAEEKKPFRNWKTISDVRVNPHRRMKKFDACDLCCYEKK